MKARVFQSGLSRWLIWVMWLLLGSYLVGLIFHDGGFDPFVDGWLQLLCQWAPAAVCWWAAYRARSRTALVLISMAVTAFTSGTTFYVLAVAWSWELPFPSFADVGYLLFYPLVIGGLFVSLLRDRRRLAWPVLLDGAVGSLGAAAVLAVLLSPLLVSASAGVPSVATVLAVAYPLFDLLIVAVSAGIAAVSGFRHGFLVMMGLTIFAVSDTVYAFRLADETYRVGTVLDAGWAVGICLIAVWADNLGSEGVATVSRSRDSWTLAVPVVASAAGLGVLMFGTRVPVSGLAVVLAGATLVAAGLRTQWAFSQLVSLPEIRRQSRTDELTGLPNRRALFADAPARMGSGRSESSALLLLDVDRFKEVNDSLGHDVGDLLLVLIGKRLSGCLRAGELMARMGGDEFAVLLDDADREQATTVAARLRTILDEPFVLEGIDLQVSVSIGISMFPDQGQDLKILLRKADMAMYVAKTLRSGQHLYVNEDNIHGDQRLRTLQELRTALATDQLLLHYQPKIDLSTGDVSSVEALVRWNHPCRGLLYPDAFLRLTEEAGLMNDLTSQVLKMALDQAALWQSRGEPLTVAVNLSPSSLIDLKLPERIIAMIEERRLSSSVLVVEITEEVMLPDRAYAREILSRFRASGVRVSIDDFGAGYSSLAYLRDLPIDELKLDRSFISPMTTDPRAAALVASTIHLAHSLGLTVVAEGIENQTALGQLAAYGCDQGQGFHISKPVPAPKLEEWLTVRRQTSITP